MKILAVSGGIDSVVMLHQMKDEPDILVAHFDHGIRSNSAEDCAFVERLAHEYGKPFVCEHAQLGENCSEATAREARYAFLRRLAKEYAGKIYVAHHADDIIESITINLLRGTGWRGLAPMQSEDIERPLCAIVSATAYVTCQKRRKTSFSHSMPINVGSKTPSMRSLMPKLRNLTLRVCRGIISMHRKPAKFYAKS